jgi:site-specific DNA-methyltransferase (adenine-specific)
LKYADPKDVSDNNNYINKWKLLIPPAPIAGQTDFSKPVGFYYDGNTRISKPGECCTESWLVAGAFNTEEETISYKSYLFTKIVRFLLLQTVVSQHVTKKNFCFVPDLDKYKGKYTDDILRQKWNITDDEWAFIESKISTIDGENSGE